MTTDYRTRGNPPVIVSPGKFEGEPVYVVWFWDLYLEGGAEFDSQDNPYFAVTPEDAEQFPELKPHIGERITLWESDTGFVYHTIAPPPIPLIAAYIGDGYCLGVANPEKFPACTSARYWNPAGEHDTDNLRLDWATVPAEDADSFCEGVGATIQGTICGDGYQLANLLAPYTDTDTEGE